MNNEKNSSSKRILSGMRVTGKLHLGHYHGVIKNWIELQHQYECFFFAADIHALTTHYAHPQDIQDNLREMLIDWLSAGVDPDAAHLFVQSHIPETAELHLLLSMITPLGWLERVPTYKDQQENLKEKDLSTYGFLGYPLLQSADILLYKSHLVPIGEDQLSHLEITREIARRFNFLYGDQGKKIILPEPQALLTKVSKFPGLDGRKMSKSYHNTIGLREDPESITKKIKTMPTDPARIKRSDPGDPEKCPVWSLHKVYADDNLKSWVQEGCTTAGIGCIECKQTLIDNVIKETNPIREKAKAIENNSSMIKSILEKGQEKARETAKKTIKEVKQVMGLSETNH
jgi:tryptophanyl-tRNA synthetase